MTLIKSISGIRGTIGGPAGDTLNPLDIVKFTSAYATFIRRSGASESNTIVVGRDARISGEMVKNVVCGTLMGMGYDVLNIGLATTPTTELAVTMSGAAGGIIITASHNPRQWNALKLLNEKGEFLTAANGNEVLGIAEKEDFEYADVDHLGKYTEDNTFNKRHIDSVLALKLVDVEAIRNAHFKVCVDSINSVGGSYRYYGMLKGRINSVSRQDVLLNGVAQGSIDQDEVMKPFLSSHQADIYYVGKVGQVGVDFNATYYAIKNRRNDEGFESSKELGYQEIHSSNRQNSDMWAGKLVVNIPLWKGNMSVGTELSKTDSHGTFLNEEQLVPSTKTDIHERNIAGFAQYGLVLSKWTVGLGVRYENIVRDYLSDGVKQDDVSRKYNNFFPNLSVSCNKGNWYWQLNINEKIHRPSYRQLGNFMQYDNRFLYEGGNPTLQPEKVLNVEAMMIYKWLNVSVGYKYLKDVMEWTKYIYPGKEFAYNTSLNFNHKQLLYASVNVSPRFGIFRPTWKINYSQQFFDTENYGSSKALGKPLLSCSLDNHFALSETIGAAMNFYAATSNADGFLMHKSSYSVNLRFYKSFANRTWIIYLSANDILKTAKERWTMYGLGSGTTKDCYNYTRNVSLQITYNFNAKRSKYKGTGAGNEEKSRL